MSECHKPSHDAVRSPSSEVDRTSPYQLEEGHT